MPESECSAVYKILTSRHAALSMDQLKTALSSETADVETADVERAVRWLIAEGRAVQLDDGSFLSDVALGRLEATARRITGAFHKKHPLLLGIPVDDLASVLPKAAEYGDIDFVIRRLVGTGVLVSESKGRIRLPDHSVEMPDGWLAASQEMLGVYAAAALQPPSSYNFQANYPRHINVRAILAILAETGALVQLEDEIYIDSETYCQVKETVRAIADRSGGEISVGAVRDALGSTRKFVLPLLELLDSEGFTRREGDVHYLAR